MKYPYSVKYRRTSDWWISRWTMVGGWCHRTLDGYWDYQMESFWFEKESDYVLFLLRWGQPHA
jgi:hypothetical protein